MSERSGEELDQEGEGDVNNTQLSRRDSITKLKKALTQRGVEPMHVMDMTAPPETGSYFMPHLPTVGT